MHLLAVAYVCAVPPSEDDASSCIYVQRGLLPPGLNAAYLGLLSAAVIRHQPKRWIGLTCPNHSLSSGKTRAGTQGKTLETGAEADGMQKCSLQLPMACPGVAVPTVGFTAPLQQLLIKKVTHRHAHRPACWRQLLN